MFTTTSDSRTWSKLGWRVMISSVIATALLSVADGMLKGEAYAFGYEYRAWLTVFAVWVTDFRYLFEQLVYAGILLFVGAKFFETRTILTIGFDKADSKLISLKAPADDNVVWIGHRYRTRLEAEAVYSAMASRLQASVSQT